MNKFFLKFVLALMCAGTFAFANGHVQDTKIADTNMEDEDPFEDFNRLMFGVNEALEVLFLSPIAILYQSLLPHEIRTGISNAAYNLTLPLQSMAYLIVGEPEHSLEELLRFGANSTFGILGFIDASEVVGVKTKIKFDFDKALEKWGVPAGPYLVLPIIGNASLRHMFTFTGETFIDPVNILANKYIDPDASLIRTGVQWGLEYSDTIERYGTGESLRGKIDMYVSLREAYFEKRKQGTKAAYASPKISIED